jgi:hypothetical protein
MKALILIRAFFIFLSQSETYFMRMFTKIFIIIALSFASIDAMIYACINQSGFDAGVGNNTVDAVINGNFCYVSMDNDYTAYAVNFGLNIERKLLEIPHFKMYGMCGAFIEYGAVDFAYLSSIGKSVGRQALFGLNVLALRPEAMITPRISIYSDISLVKYEISTEMGNHIWIVGFLSSSALGMRDAVPHIGLKFYF